MNQKPSDNLGRDAKLVQTTVATGVNCMEFSEENKVTGRGVQRPLSQAGERCSGLEEQSTG